jgi:electron transfer flavoprotein beta subunit
MRVGKIYKAFAQELEEVWDAAFLELNPEQLGLKGSPTKVKKSYTKGVKTAGKVFNLEAKESAKVIVEKLKEIYILS